MTKLHIVTTAATLSLAALLVKSGVTADALNGEQLAERWCAVCHVVTAAQRQAYADARPFEEIAKRPGFTEAGTVRFLLDPHAKMPNMDLSSTYISRLR